MAIFPGSQTSEIMTGTIDDDIMTGLAGNDTINGAVGNDVIDGGADWDDILGGAGNDTITVDSQEDLDNLTMGLPATTLTMEKIDGGDDVDTLVTGLLANDVINQGAGTLWGRMAITENFEMVQVSNASDFMLDLSTDATFGSDAELVSVEGDPSGFVDLAVLNYTAADGMVAADTTFAETGENGVMIDGMAYEDGDEVTTAGGGVATIEHNAGIWSLDYKASQEQTYAVGIADESEVTESVVVTILSDDDEEVTVDVAVDLSVDLDENVDASEATAGVTVVGDSQDNGFVGSEFADTFWAGTNGVDTGADVLQGEGGNDTLAGGDGDDDVWGGLGDDELFGGAGDDDLYGDREITLEKEAAVMEGGDDVIWAGEGDDYILGGAGDDELGGGFGDDYIVGDNGDDTLYAGADDGEDYLDGGDGDDNLFAGEGDDELYGGADDDTMFGGAGNDTMRGNDGADVIWGGAGNDTMRGNDGDDVFGFIAGSGNDQIRDFQFDSDVIGETGDVLLLEGLGFADTTAVLAAMEDSSGDVVLTISPGNTITFTNYDTVSEFSTAVDDWVLV